MSRGKESESQEIIKFIVINGDYLIFNMLRGASRRCIGARLKEVYWPRALSKNLHFARRNIEWWKISLSCLNLLTYWIIFFCCSASSDSWEYEKTTYRRLTQRINLSKCIFISTIESERGNFTQGPCMY